MNTIFRSQWKFYFFLLGVFTLLFVVEGIVLLFFAKPGSLVPVLMAVSFVWLIFFVIISVACFSGAIENRDRRKEEEEKQRQVERLTIAMREAVDYDSVRASQRLREEGIVCGHFTRGHDIRLPKYFWDVPDVGLIASSLITIVNGNITVKKNFLLGELSRILEDRTLARPQQAVKVAMIIQKRLPAMGEAMFL